GREALLGAGEGPSQLWVEPARTAATRPPQGMPESVRRVPHHAAQRLIERVLVVGARDAVARLREAPDGGDIEPPQGVRRERLRQVGTRQWSTIGPTAIRHRAILVRPERPSALTRCPSNRCGSWRTGADRRQVPSTAMNEPTPAP